MTQVNSPQQSQPQSRPENKQETRQAEAGAAERFSTAMKKSGPEAKGKKEAQPPGREKGEAQGASAFSLSARRADRGQGGGKGEGRDQGGEGGGQQAHLPRGDAILAGLIGGVKEQQLQASAQVGGAARIDGDLTSKLVDRILVSAADSKTGAEVRISLREDILPGTEIRIQRQADGGLSVQFVTNDVRAEQMLGQRQLTELQNVLAQNLQVEVRVATIRTDGSMSADAGTSGQHGQQRGSGGQDQQQDGRSRQHDLFEGLQDEA